MTYDELLKEAQDNNLIVKEKPLPISKGRIKGNRIAIKHNMTEIEKACVLAEELGHHYTAVGNILDQSTVENRKQEMRGRLVAYNKMVGLRGLVEAYNHHCRNLEDTSEYLEVTPEFLQETIDCYRSKYGICTTVDNYAIIFEPNLAILKLI